MPVFIPTTLAEATQLLSNNPDAHLLTGGTDMMVEVNFNHRHPETVIDYVTSQSCNNGLLTLLLA